MDEKQSFVRCFVALEMPIEAVKEIKKVQEIIRKKNLFIGKFTEPENLHLTLKFLGEIENFKIEKIRKSLRTINLPCFEAKLSKIGFFSPREIRILWVKLEGSGVYELQKVVDESLKEEFLPEEQFMSHITITRIKHVFDKKYFLEYLKSVKIPKIKFKVNKFYLKKSELFELGPVYSDLEEYRLSKEK
jgi:2'-5' RNA ligase